MFYIRSLWLFRVAIKGSLLSEKIFPRVFFLKGLLEGEITVSSLGC